MAMFMCGRSATGVYAQSARRVPFLASGGAAKTQTATSLNERVIMRKKEAGRQAKGQGARGKGEASSRALALRLSFR
jgi:hypothetical protein